nr:DUF2252 family protein [Nocardia sp. NBC_00565]
MENNHGTYRCSRISDCAALPHPHPRRARARTPRSVPGGSSIAAQIGEALLFQILRSRRSIGRCTFVHGDAEWHNHQGQRVAEYQQALQTVSDPLLGWTTVDGLQYYVRQFRNMKGTVDLANIDAAAFVDYVAICGRLLAKGHARTSGASMISGYLGSSDAVDRAMCRFAKAYADQTEKDHQALVEAVASGRLAAEPGI